MKIGLAGTVSVGKTTLINSLKELPQFKNYQSFTERSKYLASLGIPLNQKSTLEGQMIFMAERASELLVPNSLSDRTIWDVMAFTILSNEISEKEKKKLIKCMSLLTEKYDLVGYVSPQGVDIENNGIRITNPLFRSELDETIKYLLLKYSPKRVVYLSGDNDTRIKTLLQSI